MPVVLQSMLGHPKSTLRCRKSRLAWPLEFLLSAWLMYTAGFALFCVASTFPTAARAASILVQVDPRSGDDSLCAATLICRTIARAVQLVGASQVNLSAGVFNESTVNVSNAVALVVSGVPSSTFSTAAAGWGKPPVQPSTSTTQPSPSRASRSSTVPTPTATVAPCPPSTAALQCRSAAS